MRRSSSATTREQSRRRWRAFLVPQWKTIKARGTLSDREVLVLELRIGIVSDVAATTEQIARRLHCTGATVTALERRALTKLRESLHVKEIPT